MIFVLCIEEGVTGLASGSFPHTVSRGESPAGMGTEVRYAGCFLLKNNQDQIANSEEAPSGTQRLSDLLRT